MQNSVIQRQFHLDWLRVWLTLAVFLYHCLMFVNPFPWHVKNNLLDSSFALFISLFMGVWLMPAFFAISGISVYYALQKRTSQAFVKERVIRLGIPLVFGILILSPPQVYIERITTSQLSGSFLAFIPRYFDGLYLEIGGTGNFAFVGLHLWYLLVLLIFSLLIVPLLLMRKNGRINKPFKTTYLFFLPIPLILINSTANLVHLGGWDLLFYLAIFLYGMYLFSKESFKHVVKNTISIHIIMAIISTSLYIYLFMTGMYHSLLFSIVKVLSCWSMFLVLFYVADKFFFYSNQKLKYASQASMPFYILHQPVIVIVGYFLMDLSLSIPTKLMLLMTISFSIILIIFHFLIRKSDWIQPLFGIKHTSRENTSIKNSA
ncbi:acyltransferase family protein [Alkalihalobacterium alkalicellulosilyticum]|uniref:acyltransferase family protein n=1 Tax=Alkalihalobacterium alkalicellulosilyticum TaxID=1912214 RepID=UPI0009963AA6|nr:acyltransferase family protein [Bacillus alkalicellulosilyticus]